MQNDRPEKNKRSLDEFLFGYPSKLRSWRWVRFTILTCIDLLTVAGSLYLAFTFRFDFTIPADAQILVFKMMVPTLVAYFPVMIWAGMYRQVWRYATIQSAVIFLRVVVVGTLCSMAFCYFLRYWHPRSIFPFHSVLVFSGFALSRFTWRAVNGAKFNRVLKNRDRCIIYGAGGAGANLIRNIHADPRFPYEVIGFVDDDKNRRRQAIGGLRVLGNGKELSSICSEHGITTVIIAMPSATGTTIRRIVDWCQEAGVQPLILPELASVLDTAIVRPRNINIKDLLKRSPKSNDQQAIHSLYHNAVVMVTGGGGSIGSEVARQVLACGPKALVIVDASEYSLYQIEQELNENRNKDIELYAVLGNLADRRFVDGLLKKFQPKFILHAAAYKHVPLIEANPLVGILNNIGSTLNLTRAALAYDVDRFLLISSDKAVRPTSVMGATKRCCELILLAMNELSNAKTKFCAVRFGNVLGSSGSVIPRFLRQIESGGPVTVTHPDMQRYFMLTSEAVSLVLQSAALAEGGEIFVLDMGDPVNIYDMAQQLIRLSGKRPGEDIPIVFTGLRPGEKLFEELLIEGVERRTKYEEIYVSKSAIPFPEKTLQNIEELLASSREGDVGGTLELLKTLASENYVITNGQSSYTEADSEIPVHH